MGIGSQTHAKVGEVLASHHLSFSDCYHNPDILNSALKEAYRDGYLNVVDMIGREFNGLSDEKGRIAAFLKRLRE